MTYYKELGKKLREHHEAIDDKVERIDKYQKYTNTELNYVILSFIGASNSGVTNVTINKGEVIPFNKAYEGGIEYNLTTHTVKLKAKNSYRLLMAIKTMDTISSYCFYNETTGKFLPPLVDGATGNAQNIGEYVYTPEIDCEISIKMKFLAGGKTTATLRTNWYQSDTTLNLDNSYVDDTYFIVQEIGRQIVIDPVEHVNDSQGIEDTPVGHIIAHMGTVAPKHYLICDGTEYNITDYPYLAQHILVEFGSYNYFGGDGTTTFAVPDLRGEFLRGTGTNSHENSGNGANVGTHQGGTFTTTIAIFDDGNIYATKQNNNETLVGLNGDSYLFDSTGRKGVVVKGTISKETIETAYMMSSRPTNTSVLYCIKYQITQNNISKDMVNYSLEEQVIGSWINGKPIYERFFYDLNYSATSGTWTQLFSVADLNIDEAICINGKRNIYEGFMPQLQFDVYGGTLSAAAVSGTHKIFAILLQYTKTTDAENSFTPDMLSNISTLNTTASDEEVNEVIGGI